MKILFIGGTKFVGRQMVEDAIKAGHEVTLFNRGKTNRDMFKGIEIIRGDRDGGLEVLGNRYWDVVIDSCGYYPRVVRQSAEYLKDKVGLYVFISTVSVYRDVRLTNIDESAELDMMEDETIEEITGKTYGPLKVLCEKEVLDVYGDKALIIRPGLIVGPHDTTDRFTYWVYRLLDKGEVICPDIEHQPVQFIDVRDLSEWVHKMVMANRNGIYNAVGPENTIFMYDLIKEIHAILKSEVKLIWVKDDFLCEEKVKPFMELPLWLSSEKKPYQIESVSSLKAIKEGLTFRSLETTVLDLKKWIATWPKDYHLQAGMTYEREQVLIEKWKNQIS